MPQYLLDTNACIAIRNSFHGNSPRDAERRAARERLIARWKGLPIDALAMSFISLGELVVWVEKHSDRAAAIALLQRLKQAVPVAGPPGADGAEKLAHRYGELRAGLERSGNMIPHNDLWIAAHALTTGMTVVTGDLSDFAGVPGLSVEDWTA